MNDIDVKNKRRLIECFEQEWTDSNMRWDESEYGGVKDIRVPPSSLWKPDILMYNRSSHLSSWSKYRMSVRVNSRQIDRRDGCF